MAVIYEANRAILTVDCLSHQQPKGVLDNGHAVPKRPTESEDSNRIGRTPWCAGTQYRLLIRVEPAKSPIRQINLFDLLLSFLLKPDVI